MKIMLAAFYSQSKPSNSIPVTKEHTRAHKNHKQSHFIG